MLLGSKSHFRFSDHRMHRMQPPGCHEERKLKSGLGAEFFYSDGGRAKNPGGSSISKGELATF